MNTIYVVPLTSDALYTFEAKHKQIETKDFSLHGAKQAPRFRLQNEWI